MTAFRTLLFSATAAAMVVTASAASAQSWGYDEYQAGRAYHHAHDLGHRAHQDQRAADNAAWYGDYGAADYYARRADHERHDAWNSNRWAQHEDHVARWDYWHRGWGY